MGKNARTLAPGRRQVNILKTRKREHSRKPDELFDIIESCSWGPYLELFARHGRNNWDQWGNEHAQHSNQETGERETDNRAAPESEQTAIG
jgi:N6-adenosine-specific RNA methylase IME4